MKRTGLCVLLFISVSCASSSTFAKEAEHGSDWSFDLAPFYFWGVNISGDQSIGPVSNPLTVEFSDIFDNLDAAFIVHFEGVYKSKWGFLVDVNYLDLENKESLANSLTRKIDLDLTLSEVSAYHRWILNEHKLDFILGLRYTSVNNKIGILGGPNLIDGTQDWLDPLVGGRWIWGFADNWSLIVRGDVGGFQVGSNFSWQTVGIVEWQPFKYASFLAGYRAIGMDYEDGNIRDRNYFNFDATLHGPVIGLNFKW